MYMTDAMYTIVYSSTAVKSFSNKELENLLKAARSKNQHLGITGLLVFADDTFFQVLEGDERPVKKLYSQIQSDSRHYNIMQLVGCPLKKRKYTDWTMKYRKIDTLEGR